MKSILICVALLFSASAFAQGAPIGCTPLGAIEGRQLWTGDCVAKEPRRNEARNEMRGRIDARAPRRTQARRPIEPLPPAEEKTWWGLFDKRQ
jgi:hypothetical protein